MGVDLARIEAASSGDVDAGLLLEIRDMLRKERNSSSTSKMTEDLPEGVGTILAIVDYLMCGTKKFNQFLSDLDLLGANIESIKISDHSVRLLINRRVAIKNDVIRSMAKTNGVEVIALEVIGS